MLEVARRLLVLATTWLVVTGCGESHPEDGASSGSGTNSNGTNPVSASDGGTVGAGGDAPIGADGFADPTMDPFGMGSFGMGSADGGMGGPPAECQPTFPGAELPGIAGTFGAKTAAPQAVGGDPTGTWIISNAQVLLDAMGLEVVDESASTLAGRAFVTFDGTRFSLALQAMASVASMRGAMTLPMIAAANGAYSVSGTTIVVDSECVSLEQIQFTASGNSITLMIEPISGLTPPNAAGGEMPRMMTAMLVLQGTRMQ